MGKQITVRESTIPSMVTFFHQQKVEKENEVQQLLNEIRDIDSTISELENDTSRDALTFEALIEGYKLEWTYADKIKFALNKMKNPLTSFEIVEILKVYEPDIENKARNIASILSEKFRDGTFSRVEIGGGVYKYDIPKAKVEVPESDDLPF